MTAETVQFNPAGHLCRGTFASRHRLFFRINRPVPAQRKGKVDDTVEGGMNDGREDEDGSGSAE